MGFWKGVMLGSVAGAAYGFWTATESGEALRERIVEMIEDNLFRLTGMQQNVPERANPATWSATAANPADWEETASA